MRQKIDDSTLLSMPGTKDEFTIETNAQLALDIQHDIQVIADQVAKNAEYQLLFNVKEDKFEDLGQLQKDIELRVTLWNSMIQWEKMQQNWMTAEFKELNPDTINQNIAKFTKAYNKLERELPPNGAVPKAKQRVQQMTQAYPVVYNLRNKDLKPHHWVKIKELLYLDPDAKESDFTLEQLIQIGAIEKRGELASISDEASSEAVLNELLHQVMDKWQHMELHAKPFHGESYLLVDIDDLMRELDDSQVQLATIRGSRHVGPIKEMVDFWVSRLAYFNEVLDDWSKKFHECDKFWHDIMKACYEFPSALRATTQPGLANIFRQHNQTMDQIQVALNGLLNTKRNAFGRFFFLPNDDLLEILKEGKNPMKVMPYMNKLFDNIKTLDFSNPDDVRRMEIIAMISGEGETVQFGEEKVIPRSKPVEVWMKAIETTMVKVLKKLASEAIIEHTQLPRPQWILSTKAQHVISISQIMWTAQVEAALQSEKPVDEMKKLQLKCEKQLEELTEVVRGNLETLQRISVGALIVVDVHARDIVEEMVRDGVSSVNDFDWKKRLRYYWEAQPSKSGKPPSQKAVNTVTSLIGQASGLIGKDKKKQQKQGQA
ncbi:MAG: putative dynein heavy chain, partial [Streblomastix strix]